jgi:hypothetical protein
MIKTTLTVIFATAIFGTAMADETLAQKKQHQTFQEQVDQFLKQTNDTCGTSISATIDWDGFDKLDLSKASKSGSAVSVGQFCGEALDAVRGVCAAMKDDGKAAVKQKISKFVCRYGGVGKRSMQVANGTYTFSVDFKATSNAVENRNELMKKL